MLISPTNIVDASKIFVERHIDERGFFQEIYNPNRFENAQQWKQINWSKSDKYVLRGIHVAPYGKLVTCVSGRIFDVCVDLRVDSPTYLKCYTTILDEKVSQQVYIPANCGHAFLALDWDTSVVYLQEGCYNPKEESIIRWDDPTLAIQWPALESELILSKQDENALTLDQFSTKSAN
jgi:dTDP-4-dehydrorhamnose 3,5-epimerase